MACGDLLINSVLDCTLPFQGGVGQQSRLVLALREDVTGYTTLNDIISAVTLGTNKIMFSYDGFKQSLKPKYSRVLSPSGQSMYVHQADFFIYDYSQAMKTNLQRMANGRYIAIFENALQNLNTFELLGKGTGLEISVMERAPGENGGAFKLTLKTPDNEFEGALPQTVLATDYPSTLTLINGYLFIPTITSFTVTTFATGAGGTVTITGTNFFGGSLNDAVVKYELINQVTGVSTAFVKGAGSNQYQVVSNTSVAITFGAAGVASGTYKLKVTTLRGSVVSGQNLIVT